MILIKSASRKFIKNKNHRFKNLLIIKVNLMLKVLKKIAKANQMELSQSKLSLQKNLNLILMRKDKKLIV